MLEQVSQYVRQALHQKSINEKASQSLYWGFINLVLLIAVSVELNYGQFSCGHSFVWWITVAVSAVCFLNLIRHTKVYIEIYLNQNVLEINEKQRALLAIATSEKGFRLSSPPKTELRANENNSKKFSDILQETMLSPLESSIHSPSHQSPSRYRTSPNSSLRSFSPDGSYVSPQSFPGLNQSWAETKQRTLSNISPWDTGVDMNNSNVSGVMPRVFGNNYSPQYPPVSQSGLWKIMKSPQFNTSSSFNTSGREEVEQMIRDLEDRDKSLNLLSETQAHPNLNGSFWSYSSQSSIHQDQLASLKNIVYQPATKDSDGSAVTMINTSTDSNATQLCSAPVSKVWQKRNVSPRDLFKFEENMRIWLSMNILQPLVKLIDECNKGLAAVTPEIQIGLVGIDKLKKAALNISGLKHLNNLLPYLDVTQHQDYLVQRLRELSKGGAISEYKWNSGGKFNAKDWREEFPTDSYILIHVFALYMDNHLPPDPTQPDGRVFSNAHFVKTPEKPPTSPNQPLLFMTNMNPPHLKVVLPVDGECEVGSGHKNLIHSLILLCHYIVHQQHSHISGINLQLSGINLAWVVSSEY